MKLSSEADVKLNHWLSHHWHTNHPLDVRRWYDFIDAYARNDGFGLDEAELREYIEQFLADKGQALGETMRQTISKRVSLAVDILDYLQHTQRQE